MSQWLLAGKDGIAILYNLHVGDYEKVLIGLRSTFGWMNTEEGFEYWRDVVISFKYCIDRDETLSAQRLETICDHIILNMETLQ